MGESQRNWQAVEPPAAFHRKKNKLKSQSSAGQLRATDRFDVQGTIFMRISENDM
jgi:hypothetical protein